MKLLFLISLCLSATLSFGQTYQTLISEANDRYRQKNYPASVEQFQKAFQADKARPEDLYDAACAASLAGNPTQAFDWLNKAFAEGWVNLRHLQKDGDLASLHDKKEWTDLVNRMQKTVDKLEANYDKPLQARLLAIHEEDQKYRQQALAAQKEKGINSDEVKALWKTIGEKDSLNLVAVKQILDQNGWVGPEKVGNQANETIFLVIQHADQPTQEKYLPLMRAAVKDKRAQASQLALLEDRVAVRQGRKQIYGSQLSLEGNQAFVLPLEDPDHVDERRATMGLGPIAEYVKRWGLTWNVEEYKKQLPELEKKMKR